jgi:hypothetical protein
MKRMRLILVATALCLAVISPFAATAYAWGSPPQNPCGYAYGYSCANPYPYPYQYTNQYPYRYQYVNPYPYPYQYQPPVPPPPRYPPVIVIPGGPSVSTWYGNYTRCAQYGLHQSSCFVPDASNSPNLGSIQMEPQITIWGNCNAGQTMNQSGTNYQCSKTRAGRFPL